MANAKNTDRFEPSTGVVNTWSALVTVVALAFGARVVAEAYELAGTEVAQTETAAAADPS